MCNLSANISNNVLKMNVVIFSIRKKKKSDRFASSRMLSNALVGSINRPRDDWGTPWRPTFCRETIEKKSERNGGRIRAQASNRSARIKRSACICWWIENRHYLDAIRIAYTEARQILDNSFRVLRSIFNAINLRFPASQSRLVFQRV